MKQIFMAIIFALAMVITACAPGSWYASHPTTKEELLKKNGQPHQIYKTEDGKEKWVYKFEGDGVTYMYWLIEDGMVVRSGMN